MQVAYTSGPRDIPPDADLNTVLGIAWFGTPSGSITAAQPNRAHRIFPSNDHPSDKASYTIRAETPAASTFVANGELAGKSTRNGRTSWAYEAREPMASELIQLAFGNHALKVRGFHRGIFLRDLAPAAELAALEPAFAREVDHLDYMIERVGRYPFRSYGTFASDATFPFALETQTISLYPDFLFLPPFPPAIYEPIMVHELAHMWFGDDVAPGPLERRLAQRGPRHVVRVDLRRRILRRRRSRTAFATRTPPATSCARCTGRSPRPSTAPTTSPRCSARTSTTAGRSRCSPCGR